MGDPKATALLTSLRMSLFPRLTPAWAAPEESLAQVELAAAEASAGLRLRLAEPGAVEQGVAVVLEASSRVEPVVLRWLTLLWTRWWSLQATLLQT
jgi:hypothetical protein